MNNLERVKVHKNLSYISLGFIFVSIFLMFLNFNVGLLIFILSSILFRIEDNTANIYEIKDIIETKED